MLDGIRFDERGLVPCVAQDFASGEVLTLAYMSAESLQLTVDTGEVHFFSRSRGEVWRKGETSGNVLRLRGLRFDCDGDSIVALVDPAGPACHTGERSCFYRDLGGSAATAPDSPPAPGEPEPAAHEALAAARADPARPRDRATPGQLQRRAARRPRPDRAQDRRGGGGGGRAPAVRNPTSGSPRRRPMSSTTWCPARIAPGPAGAGDGGPQCTSPLRASPSCGSSPTSRPPASWPARATSCRCGCGSSTIARPPSRRS